VKRYGFSSKTPESALAELRSSLKGNSYALFIVNLIEVLGEIRNSRTFHITDIYLTEGEPIRIGQPAVIIPPHLSKRIFLEESPIIKADNIREVVKTFTGLKTSLDVEKALMENKGRLEFSFAVYGYGSFRCTFSKGLNGLSLTIRWLDFSIPSVEAMNYPPEYTSLLQSLVKEVITELPSELVPGTRREAPVGFLSKSGGLILHCGPTGSGKTTAMVSELYYLAQKINGVALTYENPIEYPILGATKSHILQYDIDEDFKGEFSSLLKHLLRSNPTMVMIGEARSKEELASLVDVASRGHLVFSSMHAGNFLGALEILLNLPGDLKEQVASSLLAIVSHRLVRLPAKRRDGKAVLVAVPLYEFFMPSDNHRHLIKKGDLTGLVNEINARGGSERRKLYISFADYLGYYLSKAPLMFSQEFGSILREIAEKNSGIRRG